ncbi:hypothetical protein HOY80DRAFT_1110836 [Tuber brumale]|nr:hypothetical protein HOY80DRAFT_1110836 [Tuber brumale]
MIDPQFKLAAGILCFIALISPLSSGARGRLERRDTNVNFTSMPQCSWLVCSPLLSSLLDCGQGAQITVDCFCKKTNPLICAWTVNWDCWNRTEDWYDTQCPGKPPVNLSEIPSCARSCFDGANVCMEQTHNCVCSQPRPDCNSATTTCASDEVGLYDAWYKKTCKSNLTELSMSVSTLLPTRAPTGAPTGSSSGAPITPTLVPKESLSKGATAGIAVGAIAGTFALGAFMFFVWKRKDHSPSGNGMVYYPDQKVRPDLTPSVVPPVPLVEAP